MKADAKRRYIGLVESKKVKQQLLLRVSQHGDGLYLFIPRDVVRTYDIIVGDRMKVELLTRFRFADGEKSKGEQVDAVLVKTKKG